MLLSPWPLRILAAAVIALALGWLPQQLYGHTGLARLFKLRAELKTLRVANADLRGRNQRLRAELALDMDNELQAVERIARDELGLVKPGEIVFRIASPPNPSPSPEPPAATPAPAASPTPAPATGAPPAGGAPP